MILIYSDIKIKINDILLNSILNPETNSDSPSEKSKGDRFISAKKLINNKINIKNKKKKNLIFIW